MEEEEVKEIPIEEQLQVFEQNIKNIKDDNEATIEIYNSLYNDIWTQIAYKLIESASSNQLPWMKRFANLLYKQGALIHHSEYPTLKTKKEYIGYYDFFQKTNQLYIVGSNDKLRKASKEEAEAIKKKRILMELPNEGDKPTDYIGVYVPHKAPKDIKIKLIFKIFKKNIEVRAKNPGTACFPSFKEDELKDVWESLKIHQHDKIAFDSKLVNTKEKKCNIIEKVMLKQNKLILPPLYKPNLKK
jgi:hypothetical protein